MQYHNCLTVEANMRMLLLSQILKIVAEMLHNTILLTVFVLKIILGWPQSSFGFFRNILRKIPNEIFGPTQ